MDDEEDIEVCFLNFSKVFEAVNHRFICAQLTTIEMAPLMLGWIRRCLAYQAYQVRIRYVVSEESKYPTGVFYGSEIAPVLFLVLVL